MTTLLRTVALGRRALVLAAIALTVALPSAAQSPQTDKLDPVLRERSRQFTGTSRVLVQYHGAPDTRAVTGRRGVARRTLAQHQVVVAEIDNTALDGLANDPRVARVMTDRLVFPTLARTGGATGAAAVREELGLTGRNVGVAIIDSGITQLHDDLPHVVHFKDFTRAESARQWLTEAPVDDFGHGTHVAGTIAGSGRLSGGARAGIAPDAGVIVLRVLDELGHGHVSDVIAALDYAVSLRDSANVRVINLSVGSGVFESYLDDPLALAARRAVDAGIVVVAAAGNLGESEDGQTLYGGITSPGNAPWVLTVGASTHQGSVPRSDDAVASFSSRGPTWIDFGAKPDLVAPGVGIESLAAPASTLYGELADFLIAGSSPSTSGYVPYLSLSGTSMAAPVVAGTVALMLEANPALTPNAVKAILQYTAQEMPEAHALAQGAGLVNVRGAVRLARYFANPREQVGPAGDVIAGERVAWARHLIWGNYRVTGGVPLPGSNAWTLDVTWGDETTGDGSPVVWGAANARNIVWSTNARRNIVWSTTGDDNVVWGTRASRNIVWSTNNRRNIVWSTNSRRNIVWSTNARRNIVWSTAARRNIVWSTAFVENVVWEDACGGGNCTDGDGTVEASSARRNIVWSTNSRRNIVWSTGAKRNIVWSTAARRNIVWSTGAKRNIVWSTGVRRNIVWSTGVRRNIVWSTGAGEVEQVLWGDAGW